jgi:nicotinate-nucleotide adenylyltransferase
MTFSSDDIEKLSLSVKARLGEKRYNHTVGVVKMAELLGSFCLPGKEDELIVAAYLHDVTKELSIEEHIKILSDYEVPLEKDDLNTEAILHSFSASCVVKRDFPNYATSNVLSAVFNHTIGAPDMSVFDEIIFLADYIEETRQYESCVLLRKFVLSEMNEGDTEGNTKVLHKACIKAIDNTVLHLIERKKAINTKNILTRNTLLGKI